MKIIVLILFIACGVLGFILWWIKRKSDRRIQELEAWTAQLSPYEQILDIDQEIQNRLNEIGIEEQNAKAKITAEQADIERIKQGAKEDRRQAQERQAEILNSAAQEAAGIVQEANNRAEEMAGEALEAIRNAKHYEKTAKALKNIIKGYGDEYLIPNRSVIDDLAEEFSHKDAGVRLKAAREGSRQMVKTGTAAACDYVEHNRKGTAIRFVIDAFNGKVDSILSRAKHDNFGKLDQQMQDAFHLVNQNGMAFRNARIEHEYLAARRNELRLTVMVNELRRQEQEEQRRIKQEMREEERARREYEKAIREAEKEEQLLQKAMVKAKSELAAASDEQRAEYERKLQELEEKVRAAEEKNQRALSMAQQTRRGHVYIISNIGSFGEDVFKIGLTRRLEPHDRVKELGDASVPFEFDVHAMLFSEDSPTLENKLHEAFTELQVNKVNPRKEFFRVGLLDIKKIVEDLGVETKWTMVAEAREYRETLAIEEGGGGSPSKVSPDVQHQDKPELPPPPAVTEPPAEEPELPVEESEPPQEAEAEVPPEAPCPLCGEGLLLSSLIVGINTCPHCSGSFEAA